MRRKIQGILVILLLQIVFLGTTAFASNKTTTDNTGQESNDSSNSEEGQVEEILNDVDYKEIQQVIDDIMADKDQFDFKSYVAGLATGEGGISFNQIVNDIKDTLVHEIQTNKSIIVQLIVVAVIAAIFTNFSNIFQNNQVSETAFYVTYLLMFSILTSSFYIATNIASNLLHNLLDFMKVLIPTYMVSVAFSSGAATSMMYYEATLVVITIVDFVLIRVIIPMINVYFVLVLANNMSKEDMLSKLTELLETIVQWTLKTLLALVIGFNTIQGLIVPMAEHVKNSMIIKTTSAIPGIGNAVNSVTETILGAGVLVKNAIGVGGLIVIVTICIIPIVKLMFYVLVYKFGVAIVQPISDKRIIGCMSASANAAKLLLSTVFIATLLFMISIAIIAASTNLRV